MSDAEPNPLWELPASGAAPPQSGTARARRRAPGRGRKQPAECAPVARVVVDVPLAHLDRAFDYQVPAELDTDAVPGCRVRVRFAGQLVDGFILERVGSTAHEGRLAFLERVTSPEPVLGPELAALCRSVAERYGGTLIDVLKLAIPPRHARVEREPPREAAAPPASPAATGWDRYGSGSSFVGALEAGSPARAVWQAAPGEDWPERLAELAGTVAAAGRGAVLVVPDHRDLRRLHAACVRVAGEAAVAALSADLGPAERYRRWLAISRGAIPIVVGTRAAMFAPVADPGLFVVWDDGDDLHLDPHMPYPQVRDVLMLRAHAQRASLLVAGFARTAEAQLLVETGWAHPIMAGRAEVRASAARVTAFGEDFDVARDKAAQAARLPAVAFEAARGSLGRGEPVLVQVPRRGYVPGLSCGQCRGPARCRRCAGPLMLPGGTDDTGPRPPRCRWCGAPEGGFRCQACGSARLRAVVVGARRTAEELGKAFPGVAVRTSGGSAVLDEVPAAAALVVCTPGAEPVATSGYGAALLLDGWALLGRQDLRAAEEALRRWMAAAALVRPAGEGGRVVVGADAGLATVQALIRWDPAWHAQRELAERTQLGFPPAVRMAGVEGVPDAVSGALDEIALPEGAEVLGPVPLDEDGEQGAAARERALVRVPRSAGKDLAASVHALSAVRNARKEQEPVRIQLDPLELI